MKLMFEGLGKSYHGKVVLPNISGAIYEGEKIGLIGANGIGKTTLARILAAEESADKGQINCAPPDALIIYLQQSPDFRPKISVYEELYNAVGKNACISEPVDTTVKKMLNEMEIPESLWEKPALSLSGGEKTKLMLSKALTRDFDLLILDEPTNHLDSHSAAALEKAIKRIRQSVLIISHNRYLLDRVADRIWDLTAVGLKTYKGNYSAYKRQKENEIRRTAKEYEKQQIRIEQLKKAIRTRRNWLASAQKNSDYKNAARTQAGAIKAKEKELKRILSKPIEKPLPVSLPAFDFINKFQAQGNKLSPVIIRGHQIFKSYGDHDVLRGISFTINRSEKVALLGENGAGKTTLLRIICGLDHAFDGELSLDPALKIGYFSQEFETLNAGGTILDNMECAHKSEEDIRTLLARFLFKKNDVFKKISQLSMGEKSRVALARLIFSGANFLVLDEPTNYLDIYATEKIEEVLEQYAGGILFVSHDNYLVQRIASKIIVLEHGALRCYAGDYDYYLEKRKDEGIAAGNEVDLISMRSHILQLECELAFMGGRLNEKLEDDEKRKLSELYLRTAYKLNELRRLCK